jgi:serine/threonine protein kinase
MNEEGIFQVAADLPVPERAAYLATACKGQTVLRQRIERLLASHDDGGFMQRSADRHDSAGLEADLARFKPEEGNDRIGNYKLLQKLGEGGFGTVWMAEQLEPVRRRVALKIIKPGMDSREVLVRFEQERQALALMDHSNIAKVFDAGVTPLGRPFFVMELVRGIRITEFCDQNHLSTPQRLDLFIAVCNAIQHAHQKGIIHRDIKPSNILVTLHDGVPVPKVIDFGVAKAIQSERLTDLTFVTRFEQMIGTPLYMSPEQAEMSGLDIDTRSDIYSLGVLLYELLTGRTPFDPEKLMRQGLDEMRRAIRELEPPKPSTYVSTMAGDARTTLAQHRQVDSVRLLGQIRGDLDWIVMKCLEKDRSRRYDTSHGLAADIKRHLNNEPVLARPPSAAYRFQKAWRRNKLAFAAAAAVVCALILGVVVSTGQAVRATQAEREQSRLRQEAEGLRANEARLREQAETRANLAKAQLLCQQLKFDEAEALLSRIPAPALQTEKRDAAIVFSALTDLFASRGEWKKALPHAIRAVECDPTDVMHYVSLLTLLAADGDFENHRLYRREVLDRFSQPKDPHHGEMIAKACLVLPSFRADLATLERLADAALRTAARETNNPYLSYNQFSKGLVEYRQGRFTNASGWMHKSIDDPFYGSGHMRYVSSYMVLAMAQHQVKQHDAARAAFAKGIEIADAKLPKLDSGNLGTQWYWRDWIVAQALIKEAKTLIEGPPSGSTNLKPDTSMKR